MKRLYILIPALALIVLAFHFLESRAAHQAQSDTLNKFDSLQRQADSIVAKTSTPEEAYQKHLETILSKGPTDSIRWKVKLLEASVEKALAFYQMMNDTLKGQDDNYALPGKLLFHTPLKDSLQALSRQIMDVDRSALMTPGKRSTLDSLLHIEIELQNQHSYELYFKGIPLAGAKTMMDFLHNKLIDAANFVLADAEEHQ